MFLSFLAVVAVVVVVVIIIIIVVVVIVVVVIGFFSGLRQSPFGDYFFVGFLKQIQLFFLLMVLLHVF